MMYKFWEKFIPPTYWSIGENGGLGAWNEHTFKGGLMLLIIAKQDKNDIFYNE